MGRIDEPYGVAGPIEALLIERGGGELRRREVAGRDVGALDADLLFVAVGDELYGDAGQGHTDAATSRRPEMRARRGGGGLSCPPRRRERHRMVGVRVDETGQ